MSGRGDDDWDEPIGYGRPPRYTRFKKGRSGNQKGRPRKQVAETPKDLFASDQSFRKALDQSVRVTEGGRTRELLPVEIVNKAQLKAAAGGNPQAQRDFLKRVTDLEAREAELKRQKEKEREEWFQEGLEWQANKKTIWADAEARDTEPDRPWPHPDDFLFDHEKRSWGTRGPITEEDVPRWDYLCAQRNLFVLRMMREHMRRKFKLSRMVFFHMLACIYDALLPLRWQLMADQKILDRIALACFQKPARTIDRWIAESERELPELEAAANFPQRTKEQYKMINTAMKPLLKACGYRSLAQLEAAEAESR